MIIKDFSYDGDARVLSDTRIYASYNAAKEKKDVKKHNRFQFIQQQLIKNKLYEYNPDIKVRRTSGEKRLGSVRTVYSKSTGQIVFKDVCVSNKVEEAAAIQILLHESAHLIGNHLSKREWQNLLSSNAKEIIAEMSSIIVMHELGIYMDYVNDKVDFNRFINKSYVNNHGFYSRNVNINTDIKLSHGIWYHDEKLIDEIHRVSKILINSIDMKYWDEQFRPLNDEYKQLENMLYKTIDVLYDKSKSYTEYSNTYFKHNYIEFNFPFHEQYPSIILKNVDGKLLMLGQKIKDDKFIEKVIYEDAKNNIEDAVAFIINAKTSFGIIDISPDKVRYDLLQYQKNK